MRFIGNKQNLLNNIYFIMLENNIKGSSFFDFFSGTSSVAKFFKNKNFKVFSSDILYFSYCLQRAYIKNNITPKFEKITRKNNQRNNLLDSNLEKVLLILNQIDPVNGFIYHNYSYEGTKELETPRMYFSGFNAKKIDAIRIQIEQWKEQNLLTEDEYYILIACLLESVSYVANISGVYSAFQKKWDPRALKDFIMKPINIYTNTQDNEVFHTDSLLLIDKIDVDILYLDPPYNERQYAPNYHLLETIAKYDEPKIKGITGVRDYTNQKSSFCNKVYALNDLEKIVKNAKYKYLILSYNSEGIMKESDIKQTLQNNGNLKLVEFDYNRFKSHNNGDNKLKKKIKEQLYILEKNF